MDNGENKKTYDSFEILKDNFHISRKSAFFKRVFPVTLNTMKKRYPFYELSPKRKKISKKKKITATFSFFYRIQNSIVKTKLNEIDSEIEIFCKDSRNETIRKKFNLKEILPFKEINIFNEKFILAPNVALLYLFSLDKSQNFYLYNIKSKKIAFLNYKKNSINSFTLKENFKFFGQEACIQEESKNKYKFIVKNNSGNLESKELSLTTYLFLPYINDILNFVGIDDDR